MATILVITRKFEKAPTPTILTTSPSLLACRFGYSVPNAYRSLGGALKELVEKTRKKRRRSYYEDRLEALRKSASKARAEMAQQEGSRSSVTSENVYG